MDILSPDIQFMRMALREAEQAAAEGEVPCGAVIVLDGQVIGKAHNQTELLKDPTAHAEVVAIREACRTLGTHDLSGCSLYASCEPCPMCLASIYWARISRVCYAATRQDAAAAGFDDEFLYREVALPPAGRDIPFEQGLASGGQAVLLDWGRNPGRQMY